MQNIVTNNVQYLDNYIRISHYATGDYGNYVVPDEITTTHNGTTYTKYLDSSNNVYWYNSTEQVVYNNSWEAQQGIDIQTLTKASYWINFPTPSEMPYTLNDVDKDPFTDLTGFTHRNRVRIDVLTFDCNYKYLDEDTQAYVLQAIEPEWFYAEIINPKTKVKEIHKVYASSKKTNVRLVREDENHNYYNDYIDFQVTLVEE